MTKGHEENGLECTKSCRSIKVPTDDEIEALDNLREIKNRVREIKRRISALSHSQEQEERVSLGDLEAKMARLRRQWHDWDEKRKAATRERMILLGHEEDS